MFEGDILAILTRHPKSLQWILITRSTNLDIGKNNLSLEERQELSKYLKPAIPSKGFGDFVHGSLTNAIESKEEEEKKDNKKKDFSNI